MYRARHTSIETSVVLGGDCVVMPSYRGTEALAPYMQTHTHVHTHIHTHTHTHSYTHTRSRTHTRAHTNTHIHMCVHVHAHALVCIDTHTHACARTLTHVIYFSTRTNHTAPCARTCHIHMLHACRDIHDLLSSKTTAHIHTHAHA